MSFQLPALSNSRWRIAISIDIILFHSGHLWTFMGTDWRYQDWQSKDDETCTHFISTHDEPADFTLTSSLSTSSFLQANSLEGKQLEVQVGLQCFWLEFGGTCVADHNRGFCKNPTRHMIRIRQIISAVVAPISTWKLDDAQEHFEREKRERAAVLQQISRKAAAVLLWIARAVPRNFHSMGISGS